NDTLQTYQATGWSPCTKKDLPIKSPLATPVYAFNKLFLFWVETKPGEKKPKDPSKPDGEKYQSFEATVHYSFQNFNEGWSAPQILWGPVTLPESVNSQDKAKQDQWHRITTFYVPAKELIYWEAPKLEAAQRALNKALQYVEQPPEATPPTQWSIVLSLSAHLQAYWSMGQGSGTILPDTAVGSHNGTLKGATWKKVTDFPISPAYRSVLEFDGTSSYVQVPYASTLNTATFTISCWAKAASGVEGIQTIISSRSLSSTGTPVGGYVLQIKENKWGFSLWTDSSEWGPVQGPTVENNKWTHIAATYDNSTNTAKIYVNGTLSTTKSYAFVHNAAAQFMLGARPLSASSAEKYFKGQIADVGVWNTALSAASIQYLHVHSPFTGIGLDSPQFLQIPRTPPTTPPQYQYIRLNDPVVGTLSQILFAKGIPGLLSPQAQQIPEEYDDSSTSTLDFASANALYYWELFFHAPFLVARSLGTQQQFEQAKQWYEYVFNPTANGYDLQAYWPMEEGAGTTTASTTNSHIGTLHGGVTWQQITDFPLSLGAPR
ncbi:MAG: LamG-like jellyroll fold domain-containing protein, partial [Bacteroidota bacterium]